MILLSVENVRKYYGPEPVLAGVSFEVRPGERIALVGPNGAGKTTLLRILAGRESPDGGSVTIPSSVRLGYLEQHPEFDADRTVWDEASSALADVHALAAQAEEVARRLAAAEDDAEHRRLAARFDRLHAELNQRDGYVLEHKVERVLDGLGIERSAWRRSAATLSGGQQNRLILARLLLEEPDVLLLDEPSNHLDLEATQWLEERLATDGPALVLVSHDRYLLDKAANRVLELFQGTVESYSGNFTAYRRQKSERLEVQRRTYEKQQEEIAKLEDFIRRNHYGQKSQQAEDRRKKLERIERVPPPREIAAPPMRFPAASRTGDLVVRAEGLAKGYDKPLFSGLTFDILRGEKWGILGPNGCGKTTLLRCLLDEQPPDAGRVQLGTGVKIGYFDQGLACVDPELPAIDAVRPPHKEFIEQQRRDLLARFGVQGDTALQRVASLSGGERNRTALARLAALDANVLVLDEPTNHLDLWARESLEQALREFDGTVLFVSHDRYFLNQTADKLIVVEPGRFRVIEGNYDFYRRLAEQGFVAGERAKGIAADAPKKAAAKSPPAPDGASGDKPTRRKRRFPYRKVEELESEIVAAEARVEALHGDLASPEVLRDGAKVKAASAALAQQQAALQELYEHLEEALELNW